MTMLQYNYENFIDMDFTGSASQEEIGDTNLIPDECYKEEVKQDGSKTFICIRCDKSYKSTVAVKQHIRSIHKLKKRSAVLTDSRNKKAPKKNKKIDTTEPNPIPQKIQLFNTAFCEELLKEDGV